MTKPNEVQYGSAKEYQVNSRTCDTPYLGGFTFSEKFYESSDKNYDAVLLLGARLNHNYTVPDQDIINSYMYRGFSKQALAISRLFIKTITCTYSIPDWLNMSAPEEYDYVGRESTVGTIDHGDCGWPDLASDGVLAEFRRIAAYDMKTFDVLQETAAGIFTLEEFSGYRTWYEGVYSPLQWEYPDLEVTLPLAFYLRSIGYTNDYSKPAWVFWKICAGVRFMGSEKANPKFSKGISFGGVA